MKNWLTKKNVLRISGLYALFFFVLYILSYFCSSSWCRVHDDDFLGQALFFFLPLLPVFIISLITYRMQDAVFLAWGKFAVWAVPLLMVLTYFILNSSNNGFGVEGVIGGAFDMLIIGIFYVAFIGVSIWKIAAAYDKLKK